MIHEKAGQRMQPDVLFIHIAHNGAKTTAEEATLGISGERERAGRGVGRIAMATTLPSEERGRPDTPFGVLFSNKEPRVSGCKPLYNKRKQC